MATVNGITLLRAFAPSRELPFLAALAALLGLWLAAPARADENHGFPAALNYPGCIKPSNTDQAAMNKATLDFWLYYKAKHIKPSTAQPGGFFVAMKGTNAGAKDKTTSEAHGYGMIFSALCAGPNGDPDAKKVFDGLFLLFDKHRSGTNPALMSWVINKAETSHAGSATDGDMDIAYALLLAHDQWGSAGPINYLKEARRTITDGIKQSEMGRTSHRPALGDWDKNGWNTRSSDWMTGHLPAFHQATGDPFWLDTRKSLYALIAQITAAHSPATGLMPDFVVGDPPKPADPKFLEAKTDGDYSWNACRFPLRMAVDYAHHGSAESKASLDKISNWIATATRNDPTRIKAGYRLSGKAVGEDTSMAFTAPLVAAAICDASHQQFLDRGWTFLTTNCEHEYYEDSIQLLSLLLISGNWWAPTGK